MLVIKEKIHRPEILVNRSHADTYTTKMREKKSVSNSLNMGDKRLPHKSVKSTSCDFLG